MQEDITELAKRVLGWHLEYDALPNYIPEHWIIGSLCTAAKNLAVVALTFEEKELELTLWGRNLLDTIGKMHAKISMLETENAALRPDALAWRERERAYQEQIAELKGRMIASSEKGGEG